MSPVDPGCAYPAVALTCGYQYYEDVLISPAPPSNLPERVIPTPKSTGCGALIHSSAAMTIAHTWRAPVAGVTPNVIPLEARYFDLGAATLLRLGVLAECGCAMDGVGCQLCGNALGTRFSPCAAHTHTPAPFGYTFLPNAVWPRPCGVSPPLERPSVPRPAHTSTSPPHQDAQIQSALERYESRVRTSFPPNARPRRADAQSLSVPRDFAPALVRTTDVFEGYEAWYGGAEPARGVREGRDTYSVVRGSGTGRGGGGGGMR
ncbi:hypothetical protein B0H11DRAFT_2207601 [Mycena galericulata]|nr:hypothetical protein B0H11DRAFT_2207601 [Mycena galericulata]